MDLHYIDFTEVLGEKTVEIITERGLKGIIATFTKLRNKIETSAKKYFSEEEFNFFVENYDLQVTENRVLRGVAYNIQTSLNWAKEVNFSTAISSKSLRKIFVDVDLYLSPIKYRFDPEENTAKISSKKFLDNFDKNKIIYGGAGAGKTTLVKKIYTQFSSSKLKDVFTCPIMIRFRELNYDNYETIKSFGLFNILAEILGIYIKLPDGKRELFDYEYNSILKQTVISFLEESKILLIADGFDEIPDEQFKIKIEKEFEELALALNFSKFILTSRSNDFLLKLSQTDTYEICPLNDQQIMSLIKKWIINKQKSEDLFQKIKSSPYYDTTMRPLTLSHLCAIYERKKTIPPKPRYVYDFVLNLLLESWDQERNIVRPSKYAEFYIEKKKEFLAHLSFWLTYHLNKNIFDTDDIRKCYNNIHMAHNLPISQAKKVIVELENHTGIFVQTGYNHYEFSHKSLQEFLTSKYISGLPRVPEAEMLKNLPNECAISICLSSNPNYYFELLNKDFNKYNFHFWGTFLSRLVDEKPDFSYDASVIVFFLHRIYKAEDNIFKKTFLKLMHDTNLKSTVKAFMNEYNYTGMASNFATYVNKKINVPLQERNYFPANLFADEEITNAIKKFY